MQIANILIVIILVVLVFWIFKLVAKLVFRLLLVGVILVGGIFVFQYFKKTNIIDQISSLYCSETKDEKNSLKCKCFTDPILRDLQDRFSKSELEQIKKNPVQAANEFRQSYQNQKQEINTCFEKNGESNSIVEEIFDDIKKTGFDFFKQITTE